MPRISRAARQGGRRIGLALVVFGTVPVSAAETPLRLPLACTFKAVEVGQFHGLEFVPGPAGGIASVFLAASPTDLGFGRVAIIEGDRARVAEWSLAAGRATAIGQDEASTTVLSLFPSLAKDGAVPATYARSELIGSIPLVIQSTGTCAPAEP